MQNAAPKYIFWLGGSVFLLLLCLLLSLSVGEMPIWPWQWWGTEPGSMERTILSQLRLPRSLTALCIGGMLSMSGSILQGLFKNPLVEPYTLGISGGASLGVALAFLIGIAQQWGSLGVGGFAFAGAIAISLILLAYHRHRPGTNNLLLAGIMLSILCSAATTLLLSLSTPENMTQIIYWTMGSLSHSTPAQALSLCGFAIAGLCAGVLLSQRLNLMNLGEQTARHLGVNTAVLVPCLLLLTSLLTAVCVATAGIIGFVGLVVPHILRRLAGSDYRLLVPLSFIGGGIFLVLCDLLARSLVHPGQLPVGVVCGILGGGLFVYLLVKPQKKQNASA